jgi:hypothetical protein
MWSCAVAEWLIVCTTSMPIAGDLDSGEPPPETLSEPSPVEPWLAPDEPPAPLLPPFSPSVPVAWARFPELPLADDQLLVADARALLKALPAPARLRTLAHVAARILDVQQLPSLLALFPDPRERAQAAALLDGY